LTCAWGRWRIGRGPYLANIRKNHHGKN